VLTTQQALDLIAVERARQIRKGYTHSHDMRHTIPELVGLVIKYLGRLIDLAMGNDYPGHDEWLPLVNENAIKAAAVALAIVEVTGKALPDPHATTTLPPTVLPDAP
jgi:hypothetical protein